MNHTSESPSAIQHASMNSGPEYDAGRIGLSVDEVDLEAEVADWLREKLEQVCGLCGQAIRRLDVVVVADPAMAELHATHLNLNQTTDVLSFDLRDDPSGPVEAEVYICLDEAKRCAERRGHPVRHELLLYAVHGFLHQVGYDDLKPEDHEAMHRREDELLESVGVGSVYRNGEASL